MARIQDSGSLKQVDVGTLQSIWQLTKDLLAVIALIQLSRRIWLSARSWWTALSPGKQYLLAVIPFGLGFIGLLLAVALVIGLYLSLYVGSLGLYATGMIFIIMFAYFYGFHGTSETPLRLFEYKHLTVPFLWRDNRKRTCKTCSYYDGRTRYITKPADDYESAYAPCENCGSTDFELHRLDHEPPQRRALRDW